MVVLSVVFFWFILFGFAEGVEYADLSFIRFGTFWIGIPADIFSAQFFFFSSFWHSDDDLYARHFGIAL